MITVTPLDKISNDERGYTYEYFHERYDRHLLCFRKAGTISGRHYHKGLSLTKNPEILVLVHGNVNLNWKHINSGALQTTWIEAPARIEIPPYIWHELVALSDCSFIELNALSEHQADTFTDTGNS